MASADNRGYDKQGMEGLLALLVMPRQGPLKQVPIPGNSSDIQHKGSQDRMEQVMCFYMHHLFSTV